MDLTRIASALQGGVTAGASEASKVAGASPDALGNGSFAQEIGESLSRVNQELNHAEASARELAAGKGDLVETMIALGRADVSLRMVVNLRNKVLESYNEIMRMQV